MLYSLRSVYTSDKRDSSVTEIIKIVFDINIHNIKDGKRGYNLRT